MWLALALCCAVPDTITEANHQSAAQGTKVIDDSAVGVTVRSTRAIVVLVDKRYSLWALRLLIGLKHVGGIQDDTYCLDGGEIDNHTRTLLSTHCRLILPLWPFAIRRGSGGPTVAESGGRTRPLITVSD